MSNGTVILSIITIAVFAIALIIFVIFMIRKKSKNKIRKEIEVLETDKNLIISPSILTELNKVESLINNEAMEKRYKSWQERFDEIKNKDIPVITDMLLDIENLVDTNDINCF